MSYERFHRNPRPEAQLEDAERSEFLVHLDAAPFEVTDFEAQFIESHCQAVVVKHQRGWWTEGRRRVCDTMRERYGGQL